MSNFIYHNPRWGKSRKSVEILNNKNIDYQVIEYLKNPLNKEELKTLFSKLGINPAKALRSNEVDYKENNVKNYLNDDEKIIELMIQFPKIIENIRRYIKI